MPGVRMRSIPLKRGLPPISLAMFLTESSLRVCLPVAAKEIPADPFWALRYFSSASSSRRL